MKFFKVIFILLIAIIVYAISVKTRVPEEIESVEIEVKEDSTVNLYTMELNLENFKQNLPYAEDPEYIQKVKFLVNKLY